MDLDWYIINAKGPHGNNYVLSNNQIFFSSGVRWQQTYRVNPLFS